MAKKLGKTGRYWKRVSSAPGEAPAVQSGQLYNSLQMKVSGKLERTVGTTAPHGAYLEFGTSKMAPRPYLRPSLHFIMGPGKAEKIIAEQLRTHLK